jgi:hypothetical protein
MVNGDERKCIAVNGRLAIPKTLHSPAFRFPAIGYVIAGNQPLVRDSQFGRPLAAPNP